MLNRIKVLAIPPAWSDVWICSFTDCHIQATGRDAKGRKQYRSSTFSRSARSTKYEHAVAFADALPGIRDKVKEHMALRGLPREKAVIEGRLILSWLISWTGMRLSNRP